MLKSKQVISMSEKFSIEDKTEELVDSMAKFDERNFAL
jgi:hypothetical protein